MKKASSAVKNLSTEADQTEKTPMIAESNIGVPARLDSARLAKSVGKDKKFLTLKQTGEQNWYVIHTYSGYEEQVS